MSNQNIHNGGCSIVFLVFNSKGLPGKPTVCHCQLRFMVELCIKNGDVRKITIGKGTSIHHINVTFSIFYVGYVSLPEGMEYP